MKLFRVDYKGTVIVGSEQHPTENDVREALRANAPEIFKTNGDEDECSMEINQVTRVEDLPYDWADSYPYVSYGTKNEECQDILRRTSDQSNTILGKTVDELLEQVIMQIGQLGDDNDNASVEAEVINRQLQAIRNQFGNSELYYIENDEEEEEDECCDDCGHLIDSCDCDDYCSRCGDRHEDCECTDG